MKNLFRKILLLVAVCTVGAAGLLAAGEPEKPDMVELTAEERAWMEAHPVILVGHDPTYAPYVFMDNSGRLVGIDIDFLDLIAQRTGLKFRNVVDGDWPQVVESFKARRLDLLMSLGYSEEREQHLIYTEAYSNAPNVIVTRADSSFLFDLRGLKGRTVGVPRGYAGLRRALLVEAPECKIVEFSDMTQTLEAVARGEVFAAVADVVNASYLVRTLRLSNLRLGSVVSGASAVRLGVRKDWPQLAGILNKALASISPLERKQVSDRWVAVDYATSDWWVKAFRISAAVGAGVLLAIVLLFLHNRRLARELAERRRVQAELEQTYDGLARISEQKSELLRTVTHDLRNPLTGLTLGIDLLRTGDPLDADTRLQLDQMRTTAQQMMRLINDLVDANVLESGRRNFTWARVDAAAALREAMEGIVATAERKGICINFTAQEPTMAIQSDLTAVRQVADNLISNAIKFSPRDSVIEVGVRWTGTGLCMQVRDHGPGISPEAQARVFTQYGQGDAKPTGGEKSIGLGLWIVQRVVAALHGRVWCEDAPGGGTVFLVELPRHPPSAPGSI